MDKQYVYEAARTALRSAKMEAEVLQATLGGAAYALEESALNEAVLAAEAVMRNLLTARAHATIVRLWDAR